MNTALPGSERFCRRTKERCRRMAHIIMMKKQTGLSNSVITGKPESTLHPARRYLHFTMISCKKRTKPAAVPCQQKPIFVHVGGFASGWLRAEYLLRGGPRSACHYPGRPPNREKTRRPLPFPFTGERDFSAPDQGSGYFFQVQYRTYCTPVLVPCR